MRAVESAVSYVQLSPKLEFLRQTYDHDAYHRVGQEENGYAVVV